MTLLTRLLSTFCVSYVSSVSLYSMERVRKHNGHIMFIHVRGWKQTHGTHLTHTDAITPCHVLVIIAIIGAIFLCVLGITMEAMV